MLSFKVAGSIPSAGGSANSGCKSKPVCRVVVVLKGQQDADQRPTQGRLTFAFLVATLPSGKANAAGRGPGNSFDRVAGPAHGPWAPGPWASALLLPRLAGAAAHSRR